MIDDNEVKKIAKLAYLDLDESQLAKFKAEINSILGYVQKLDDADVSKVSAMSHVHGSANVFREDIAQKTLTNEEALKNAPDTSGRFIRVPIIIDQSGETNG